MAERYTRVFTQQGQFYCSGAPVLIEAGALLKDNQTGKIIAQIKFKNISPKVICALTVRICAKDVTGVDIKGIDSFQYLDLNVRRDEEFGAKTPIVLPNAVARSFSCECVSAVFSDDTVWECEDDAVWTVLPAPVLLKNEIGAGLAEQYKRDTNSKAEYKVNDHADLWYCACGAINHSQETICHQCRTKKEAFLAALDVDILTANKEKRDDAIAVMLTEKEEAQRKHIASIKKKLIIAFAVLALICGAAWLTSEIILPTAKYNQAISLMDSGKYFEAISIFATLGDYRDSNAKIDQCYAGIIESKYQNAIAMMNTEKYDEAISIFTELGGYKDSADKADECYAVICARNYRTAVKLKNAGEIQKAAIAFGKSGDYKDAKTQSFALWNQFAVRESIAAGRVHSAALRMDGTVIATKYLGNAYRGQCDVTDWKDIVAISAGGFHTVGLKKDGTVVATPYKLANLEYGEDRYYGQCEVSEWKDIVAISAGEYHSVGLKSDGTVVVTKTLGDHYEGEGEVSSWTDIIAISAGNQHTVGLRQDGTVIAVGANSSGQCNVSDWTDIIAISAGNGYTVGLKSNGTVVAVGSNYKGRCDVSGWKNIVAICAGDYNTFGIKSDGTVVIAGSDETGQHEMVSGWKNMAVISSNTYHAVGIKHDGTVCVTRLFRYVGSNFGEMDLAGWSNIKVS